MNKRIELTIIPRAASLRRLVKYWHRNGERPITLESVVDQSLELLDDLLVKSKQVEKEPCTSSQALSFLKQHMRKADAANFFATKYTRGVEDPEDKEEEEDNA